MASHLPEASHSWRLCMLVCFCSLRRESCWALCNLPRSLLFHQRQLLQTVHFQPRGPGTALRAVEKSGPALWSPSQPACPQLGPAHSGESATTPGPGRQPFPSSCPPVLPRAGQSLKRNPFRRALPLSWDFCKLCALPGTQDEMSHAGCLGSSLSK